MDEASQLSREIEHLLQDIPTEKQLQPLEHRAAKLKQLLASDHPLSSSLQEENVSVYKRQSRTLWVVGNDAALLDGFLQAAATHSLQVEVFSTISELRECHSQSSPDAILLVLACTETDDIILHSLSDHYPKVPLFVVTASPDTPSSENLQQRSKAVQLGAKGFWQGEIVPDAILQTIVQSLQPVVKTTARILVVDDDLALLEALQTILHPWGFELTLLNHPQQFWGTLEQVQPDLVILDVEMPEVSGIELCQVVRHDEQWGDLPILFLSAHTDDATLHKIFTVGADDYVSKPVRAVELVSRVLRRLEQARLLKHLRQLRTL
jgi:DNA-binding response OmpR family regulator